MNMITFVSLLFGLQALYWFVGRKTSKHLKTEEEYFLAGKDVRFFPLMMTFLATQVGGGLVLGAADEAYKFGWSVILYPIGAALGLMLLGTGIGRKLAQFPVSTVAQIFEVAYGSAALRKMASVLSVVSLFMVLVAQVIASSKFLVSVGFSNVPLFILFWGIVIIYTVQGGLKAVISTDLMQAGFFSLVFIGCFAYVFGTHPVALQMEQFAAVSSKICGWLLMPLLFIIIGQDMGQRCFAGESARIVQRASFWAGIGTLIVCVVPIYFGVLAKNLGLDVPAGSSALMMVIEKTTNPTVTAFVGCAILAAIISTATSLINAISSNLSNDFNLSFLKNNVRMIKIITAGISIGAIFFAFFFNNIVDLLIQSYDLSVSCLFVPLLFALFKRTGNFTSALLSILCGAAGFALFQIYPVPFPKELASIALSFAGYGIGELIPMEKYEKSHDR